MNSDYIVPVQAMSPPCGLNFFVEGYDLGYGICLNAEQCLKLIDWWENQGGKEEYEKD